MSEKVEELEMIKRWAMRLVIACIVIGSTVGGCSYINKKMGLEDDHFLEELAEHHIEKETGLDIDLSHESPEK